MATRMQQRRGTAQQWTDADPRLESGEIGFETDTNQFKIGDGVNVWSDLSYFKNLEDLGASLDDYALANLIGAANGIASLNDLGKIPTSQLPDALSFDAEVTNAVSTAMATEVSDRNTAISTARSNAIAVASADATSKSNAAQTAAEATASADATTKANNAKTGAESTAANALSTHNSETINVHGIANTAALATKTYVDNAAAEAVTGLVDGAPELLNTINELADAIGNNATFANTVLYSVDAAQQAAEAHAEEYTANAIASEVANRNTAIGDHSGLTTNVHGIANTLALVTSSILTTQVENITSLIATQLETVTSLIATESETITNAYSSAIEDQGTDFENALANLAANVLTDLTNLSANVLSDYTDAISAHGSDTTNVHGIADTTVLTTATQVATAKQEAIDAAANASATALSTHNSETVNVHGIANTAALATQSYADTAEADAITAAGTAADSKIANAVAALTKSSVGLANVDNTADSAKPVSTAQANAIATAKAEAIADATSQIDALLTGAPAALNTLDELAAALGDDANFASTVTTNLAAKAPLASPTFTGTVTVAAAGVAFTDGTQTKEGVPSRTPISQKTAGYTLTALTERDSLIEMSSASAMTLTIPTDATLNFPIGTTLDILQTSTGQVTIAGAGGVTVNATPGLKLRTQWSSVTLLKRAANTWVAFGDLMA